MASPLVIVESPAKARTIAGYLGDEYVVESSIGHIRDLPRSAADVPKAYKGEPWARLGVDTENDFKPLYVVSSEKKEQVRTLRRLLEEASELYLATDEDREGEAIAWHLIEVLNPNVPVHRMVFHEITPEAIQHALDNPREIDRRLVDAQEARRILDRLYGYEVSPVLWKKVRPQLSAGRVQSVATRIVVERERERMQFRSGGWWDLEGMFALSAEEADRTPFPATLVEVGGVRVATGKDFDALGNLSRDDVVLLDEAAANDLIARLDPARYRVRSVDRKPYTRRPYPPFMTSSLQVEAGRKLRLSSAMTMSAAQRLYERGYITYMRTDSTTLSDTALEAARTEIRERFGPGYLPSAPRQYTKKVKNAQEAHEAIRPAGDQFRGPEDVKAELAADEYKLYELIWKRTVASQMADARGESILVRFGAATDGPPEVMFAASGKTILFPGFLRAYVEGSDDPEAELEDQEHVLPDMSEGDGLTALNLEAKSHETQPPARFTEASLVRRLEDLGVGRPSTYASIISTIIDRGYVWKRGSALVPSFTAFAVVTLLERHFPDLVDYAFTARMEDDLDEIASGDEESVPWLSRFYFGASPAGDNGTPGLHEMVNERLGEIDARDVNSIPIGTDADGNEVIARVGRYGPYLQRGEQTASIPEDLPPDELNVDRAVELIEAPSGDRELGVHPESGLMVYVRAGRYGPYVQMGEHDDETGLKPKTASLFADMSLEQVSLEEAVRLLSLPRVVGADPADGREISVQNGRYGPYLKKGAETRSLEDEQQLFTITLDECLRLLAEPKRRRGQREQPVLSEIGMDPVSERPIVLKDGRFGPYVTDGEVNASLRKTDSVEQMTLERAAELLQMRRDRGPAKKKPAAKKGAKKAAKKKPAAKKGAKKAAKKKPAAKKGAKKAAKKKPAAKKGKAAVDPPEAGEVQAAGSSADGVERVGR